MKLCINSVGGGIFSHFYIAIANIENKIENLDSIESIYICPQHDTIISKKCKDINPFDFVLDQTKKNFDTTIESTIYETFDFSNKIENDKLGRLKNICSKIKIKQEITSCVDTKIDNQTLGIHVRLTDMFVHHPHYISKLGETTEAYINKVNEFAQQNRNIFVSSDNKESLLKFKKRFNIISNNSRNLSNKENSKNYYKYQIENIDKQWFWHDSFLDMISLSKCGTLIYNFSSLNTVSFLYSSTIKNTYRLGH